MRLLKTSPVSMTHHMMLFLFSLAMACQQKQHKAEPLISCSSCSRRHAHGGDFLYYGIPKQSQHLCSSHLMRLHLLRLASIPASLVCYSVSGSHHKVHPHPGAPARHQGSQGHLNHRLQRALQETFSVALRHSAVSLQCQHLPQALVS